VDRLIIPRRLVIDIVRKSLTYIIVSFFTTAFAMPPNTDMLDKHIREGKLLPYYLTHRPALLDRGIDVPTGRSGPMKSTVSGDFRALAILIRFADKDSSVNSRRFDTLLFVNRQSTVRNYYAAVSYGQMDLLTVNLPSSIGWRMAPQTYAYYCNAQNGTGSYPSNSQRLCEDIIDQIDPIVDFSQYDNNGDGSVDAIILIHTGPGAEFTQNDSDIWSHSWSITPRSRDGVYISDYCIQPEYWNTPGDMTCGVFCHELGHVLGLPDLYDTDYSSRGVGKWSLMASGSWNGPTNLGNYPAEPDAWCRIQLGFSSAVNVGSNTNGVNIMSVEGGGNIYRLWSGGALGSEYFLVENRQRTGYDAYLPSDGLLVWHIDGTRLSSMTPNDNEWYPGHTSSGNYGIALEQADGLYQLEKLANSGDAADPFPGTGGKIHFSSVSVPSSYSYAGEDTYVAIENISSSQATMTADFKVSLTSAITELHNEDLAAELRLTQNYPNPFNPTTRIRLDLPRSGHVTICIYDILGRKINVLLDGTYPAGTIFAKWNGIDFAGNQVSSGIYFYEAVAGGDRGVGKMTLIR